MRIRWLFAIVLVFCSVMACEKNKKKIIAPVIPSPTTGSIVCQSTPTGTNITFDNTPSGQITPFTFNDIQPGLHYLQFHFRGYEADYEQVNVIAGVVATVQAVLTAACPADTLGDLTKPPTITINPPAKGASNIGGTATNIDGRKIRVVLWVLTNQWYVQPFVASPYTDVCGDGTWSTYTHPWDRIVALLVDATYVPGATRIYHPSLDPGVVAWAEYPSTGPATVEFSGYRWGIKVASDRFDPGPNYWSNDPAVVHVEADGLHLKIVNLNGHWQCAEVHLLTSLGYGIYTVQVNSRLDQLDVPTVAAPMFTYESPGRELDFETAGDALIPGAENGQFVVQPYTTPGNLMRFVLPASAPITCRMEWQADQVRFLSWQGTADVPPLPGNIIQDWTYHGANIPPPGAEKLHINLWLFNGQAPTNGVGDEMVISSFTFRP